MTTIEEVEAELVTLGRAILEMDEDQRRAYLRGCDERDLDTVERAITAAELEGADWHATPATMAHYLSGGEFRLYRYFKLMGEFIAEAFQPGQEPHRQIWIPSQMGKGLDETTPIHTPTGWTTIGELQPGDTVFGGDGRPCTVTYVAPRRLLDCYRVDFHDGASLTADGDHLWRAWDGYGHDPAAWKATRAKGCWTVVDTRALAANPGRYRIPQCPGLTLPERPLPIDPYALGVWLGDGASRGAGLTCADDEILEHLDAVGEPARRAPTMTDRWRCTWAGSHQNQTTFQRRLRRLGLLGDKHIPAEYLKAGDKQRLALLQGLMDTDGYCGRQTSGYTQCEFTSTSRDLAHGVEFLARSLGVRTKTREGRATLHGRDCGPKWRVSFTTELPVFRMSRKARLLYDNPGARRPKGNVGIKAVTETIARPTVCIQVDSPDQTYLAGPQLTVTHNTSLVGNWTPVWALDRNPKLRIIYVTFDANKAVEEAGKARDLAELHADRLRFRLRPDRRARGRWSTPQGGGLYAIGIHGGISGWPADMLLVDDLFSGWQEAHSATTRNFVWNTMIAVLRKRVQGYHCPILYTTTRWHEDDPPARSLRLAQQDPKADQYVVLRLASRAEPPDPKGEFEAYRQPDPLGRAIGEVIEPLRFDDREVAAREAGSQYLANALERQRPTPEEGGEIKRAWFKLRDAMPPRFDIEISSWDVKLKDKEAGDFVAGGWWGRVGSAMWLGDIYRGQWNQATTENAIALCQVRHPHIRAHYIENTGNGPEVMAALRMAHRGYEVSDEVAGELGMTAEEREAVNRIRRGGQGKLIPVNVKGDKSARMRAVSGSIEGGDVYLCLLDAVADVYLAEMAAFGPNAAHDDQVDMTSQALSKLLQARATATRARGQTPKTPTTSRPETPSAPTGPPTAVGSAQRRGRVRSGARMIVPRQVPGSGR